MKKIYSFLFLLFCVTTLSAQTLFTYGDNAVSKEEFLNGYNKNRVSITEKKQSLREYLDLYIKFKLKVKCAEEEHLDTLSTILEEVKNFRTQIETAYLNNDSVLSDMVKEAFQRQQKDIHLVHFYVLMLDNMSPQDSLAAYNALLQAYQSFAHSGQQKKESPADIIKGITNKFSPVKGGDLGYITAFSIPYTYENFAYALSPNEISKPYRSKNAWHLFLDVGEKKAIGKWKVAQLFFAIPPHPTAQDLLKIKNKADSVYQLLLSGSDFAALAKQYSQDKNTYMNGGRLPEFGTGKYDTAFVSQITALKNDGDFSKPFLSSDGYHIVMRLQHSLPPSVANEDNLAAMKQQVLQDTRGAIAKEKAMAAISAKVGYNRNAAVSDAALFRYADSAINNKNKMAGTYPISDSIIFSFATENITGQDWLKYVLSQGSGKQTTDRTLLNNYITSTTVNYYQNHLEDYNADFKYQMQEFKEGNLLFEIMQEKVWNKAAMDSVGLVNYYAQHKENYTWIKSADLVLFNCADTNAAKEVSDALKRGEDWRMIAKESQGRIQADSNRYELAQIQVPAGTVFKEGQLSAPLVSMDNTASLVQVLKLFPENEPRSFAEAKGMVINDYQNLLEEQWLQKLQQKYPVIIQEKIFKSLL